MLGTVTASMNEGMANTIRRTASQAVTNALGSVRWVRSDTSDATMVASAHAYIAREDKTEFISP